MANALPRLQLSRIVFFALLMVFGSALTITAPPTFATAPLAAKAGASSFWNCDGVGIFTCPTANAGLGGSCYLGEDGFVGCCTARSCAARTTCIKYTENVVQSCDPNTGGCVVCTRSDAPECVTLSNIVDHRYVMYCDSSSKFEILSYTPLVTTGSMDGRLESVATSATSTSPFLTMPKTYATEPPIATSSNLPTEGAQPSNAAKETEIHTPGISRSIVGAISAGSAIGAAIILGLLEVARRHRKRVTVAEKQEFGDLSSSNTSDDTARAVSKQQYRRTEPKETLTPYANDTEDNLRSLEAQKTARVTEGQDRICHELEDPKLPSIGRPNWNSQHPYGPLNPTAQYPGGNIQNFTAYRSEFSIGRASELPSIRQVHPSSTYQASLTPPAVSHPPADFNYVVSPLIGSIASSTPLMDQWGPGDNPSVGERTPQPSATVDGPMNWPSQHHIKSNTQSGSGHKLRRSITSATGGDAKWISPEIAMEHGYNAGEEQ